MRIIKLVFIRSNFLNNFFYFVEIFVLISPAPGSHTVASSLQNIAVNLSSGFVKVSGSPGNQTQGLVRHACQARAPLNSHLSSLFPETLTMSP